MFSKKGWLTRTTSVLCTAALLCGGLSGCGGNTAGTETTSKAQTTASAKKDAGNEKVTFTVILPYTDEQPAKDNIVEKKLQEATNSEVNIEWTPMVSYGDKYNVLMSSGQLPDVLMVPDLKSTTFMDAARNNQFWDLTEALKGTEFTGLKNINPIAVDNSKVDGKNYVIPRERTIRRKDVCYRADWAKKAGLDAPDTIEKMYKMAKTFAEGDFDGNGKKDTVGLLLGTVADGGGQSIDCLNELIVANGGLNGWGMQGGKLTATVTTPEYFSTIQWLRKMCKEGIVSKDFAITKTTAQMNDYIDKEKAGLWLSYGLPGLNDPILKAKQKADPKVKRSDVYGFTYLKDASGKYRTPAETGLSGGFAIPKSSVKDETKEKGLLRFFNYICTKEGQRYINNGIEGRHYQKIDETTCKEITDANGKSKDLLKEFNCMNQLSCAGNYVLAAQSDDIGARLAKERVDYEQNAVVKDLSAPLVSETFSKKNSTLSKNFDTALFKYILGQIDDTQFKAAIQQWRTDGGDKITSEFQTAIGKASK